ncbi:MAG: leucine-rich repeat domain-containing protein [Promethearchaeota archaeon]
MIEIKGEKISIIDGILDLQRKNINDFSEIKGLEKTKNITELNLSFNHISEIKGLNKIINLKKLSLNHNNISEIKGLENLRNLEELSLFKNEIVEIKGLETLTKLRILYIGGNHITKSLLEKLGGLSQDGKAKNPQKFVQYCDQDIKIMVLDPIPISGSIEDLESVNSKITQYNTFVPSEIEKNKMKEINTKISEFIKQKKFVEALNLLNNAKKIAIENEYDELSTDIRVKIEHVKSQRINYYLDEALTVFSNSIKCTIQDVNEYLSSLSPDFNFQEKKLKFKILSRLKHLNLDATLQDDYVIFNKQVEMMPELFENQSQSESYPNISYQPIVRQVKKSCSHCGKKIDLEAHICPYCGTDQ